MEHLFRNSASRKALDPVAEYIETSTEECQSSNYKVEASRNQSCGTSVEFKASPSHFFPTPHPANANKSAHGSEEEEEEEDYTELAVSKMVARIAGEVKSKMSKTVATSAIEEVDTLSKSLYVDYKPNAVCQSDDATYYSTPMDEPPLRKPNRLATNKEQSRALALKKLEPHSAAERNYSDPPATLIIQSLKPYKPRNDSRARYKTDPADDRSNTRPAVSSIDRRMNSKGKTHDASDILLDDLLGESTTSPTDQATIASTVDESIVENIRREVMRKKKRDDKQRYTTVTDPELGEDESVLKHFGEEPERKNCAHCKYTILVIFLTLFVVFASGFLVVYIIDYLKSDPGDTVVFLNDRNQTSGPVTDFIGTMQSTPMDPFFEDCSFNNSTQPHIRAQCTCNGEIAVLTSSVREKYYALRMLFISMGISTSWDLPEESCDPRNQAMVWLATTYSKDRADLTQKYVLASFFLTMSGFQWADQTGWMDGSNVCTWTGVGCSDAGLVTSIFLYGKGLKGTLSKDIALLSSLESFSLRNNGIVGTIPENIFTLPNLRELGLSVNSLYGQMPEAVGQATKLEVLQVDMNNLDGTISTVLGKATSLKRLNLGYNAFEGNIPLELFELVDLNELSLEANTAVTGRLPDELRLLSNLSYLSVSSTSIKSRIPSGIESLTNMRVLKMASTLLSGEIPAEIATLTNLNHLDLSSANFRQALPSFLNKLSELSKYLLRHRAVWCVLRV